MPIFITEDVKEDPLGGEDRDVEGMVEEVITGGTDTDTGAGETGALTVTGGLKLTSLNGNPEGIIIKDLGMRFPEVIQK